MNFENYKIRKAKLGDSREIWEIRNHPSARKNFNNSKKVLRKDHELWFNKKYFNKQNNYCFILEDEEKKVIGYCRFDFEEKQNVYIISIAINSDNRGKGLGGKLLNESLKKFTSKYDILAEIKKQNISSIKIFERNNFIIYKEDENNCYLKCKKRIKYMTNIFIKKSKDSNLLNNRIRINNKYSQNNLNDWIFSKLNIKDPATILDLCCGRGNQTSEFVKKYPKAIIYGLDISQESLDQIKGIKKVCSDIDNISINEKFDLIHCSYGLYYSKDYKSVIKEVHSLLKYNGTFMIVGPTDNNNKKLFNFIKQLYPIDEYIIYSSRDFMNDVFKEIKKIFKSVNKSYFYNQVNYSSPENLYIYIKSSTMYKEKYDKELKKLTIKYFKNNKEFIITKKAMAIIAKK